MCVKDEGVEAIVLCDFGSDVDGTLVAKLAAEFDVVEGEGIVGRFGPEDVSLSRLEEVELTDHAGRTSRSEAILTKLLVTSLWQNLFCVPKVFVAARANLGRRRSWVRGAESSSLAAEEKLLERLRWAEVLKWIEQGECDIAENNRVELLRLALHLVKDREQSLAGSDRAARVKVRGEEGLESLSERGKRGEKAFNWYEMMRVGLEGKVRVRHAEAAPPM
jgi:hypothetical protein